jgi:trehalose-6-phosphate synthase
MGRRSRGSSSSQIVSPSPYTTRPARTRLSPAVRGGLATALARPHAERDSLWIGWPGAAVRSAALRQHLERRLRDDYRCVPVFLSAQNIQRYYDGVSNRALWPLLHFFQAQVRV